MVGRTSGRSRCRHRVHRLSSFVAACLLILAILTLLPIAEATAAGGAHIVDDSETEAPGGCHLETWVSRFVPGDGYANASPACTTMRLPWLELGAAYQHYWDQVIGAPLFGPALKINFQHFDNFKKTIGVGLGLNAGVNLSTGNLGYASLPVLVTVPINEKVRLNLNAGWSYLSTEVPNAFFYGGQFVADVGWDLSLMIEAFGRAPNGVAGMQMGLRYTPEIDLRTPFDFDLLVGSFFDQVTTRFFTIGVTVRF